MGLLDLRFKVRRCFRLCSLAVLFGLLGSLGQLLELF
jgi:hypothetical protein